MNNAGAPPLDWWEAPFSHNHPQEMVGLLIGDDEFIPQDLVQYPFASPPGLQVRAVFADTEPTSAPPLDWWNIPPGGYPGAHYAVWPPELLIRPIKAMTPDRVCRTCGEPSRRIVGKSERYQEARRLLSVRAGSDWDNNSGNRADGLPSAAARAKLSDGSEFTGAEYTTLGFSDCSHDNWRPGLVLDPFAGSGTTLSVASGHGRDSIGIDIDERNYRLALDRVGPLVLEQGVL
jgi:hypothetical protein